MENKILRYLELSKEFTTAPEEYKNFNRLQNSTYLTIGGTSNFYSNSYSAEYITNKAEPPSKLEQYEVAQKELIEKAKRYEEYLKLQTGLLNYYQAKNKLEE